MNKIALTYDDIQLVPKFSRVNNRSEISLRTLVSRRYGILIPLVASPMDTVCELDMAFKMYLAGGVGCIHRFMTIKEQCEQINGLYKSIALDNVSFNDDLISVNNIWDFGNNWHAEIYAVPIMAAIGVSEADRKRAVSLVKAGANILMIDVAHGHHENVIKMIKWCKKNLPAYVDIIAGNIATAEAAEDLENAGADGLRVGIGGGSLCTTRIKTGFGIPNVTSIENISKISTVPIMADGGIKSSGDIAKALAVGADCIMLGSMLAGTEETPGKIVESPDGLYKRYRGSASLDTKSAHGQAERNVEGESTMIPFKGGVKFILNGILDGIRSALSYGGASSIKDYSPEYLQITNSGINESKPHLL